MSIKYQDFKQILFFQTFGLLNFKTEICLILNIFGFLVSIHNGMTMN